MKDYLNRFLATRQKNTGALESGNRQNRQKPDEKTAGALGSQPTKPTEETFDAFVGDGSQERASFPVEFNEFGENVEMHDSALFAAGAVAINTKEAELREAGW